MSLLAAVLAVASALVNLAGAAILGLASQPKEAFCFLVAALLSAAGVLSTTADASTLAGFLGLAAVLAGIGFLLWTRPSEHVAPQSAAARDTKGNLLVSLTVVLPALAAVLAWLG
jgi:hypothetical protein